MKTCSLFITSLLLHLPIVADPLEEKLSFKNYQKWVEYVQPSEQELSWQKIAWRNRFMTAVEEAKELDRPILLWAMNGNPCGET